MVKVSNEMVFNIGLVYLYVNQNGAVKGKRKKKNAWGGSDTSDTPSRPLLHPRLPSLRALLPNLES
jgi:hypothetical protein